MIYLDNNATTFLDPEVKETLIDLLGMKLGNPSSIHGLGQHARSLYALALQDVASFFQVKQSELLFTSGATEALNTLLFSLSFRGKSQGHIITSMLEHPALQMPIERLEKNGWKKTALKPNNQGEIHPSQVESAIEEDTQLIALMAANNETGVKTDIIAIGAIAERYNIPFLIDGVSILGKESFTLPRGASAAVFSSHKIHGPQGMGLGVIRKEYPFTPLILGGKQGYGRRGGTENLVGMIGFAKAISLLNILQDDAQKRMTFLRNRLEAGLQNALKDIIIHGKEAKRIANTSSIAFLGVEGDALLIHLDLAGVHASHGSACSSGSLEPSRVLLNMGLSQTEARSTIRFSLSRMTNESEIDRALEIIVDLVRKLRI